MGFVSFLCCALAFGGASAIKWPSARAGLWENHSSFKARTKVHVPIAPSEDYYWSSRGGNYLTNSFAPYTVPHDLSAEPTWVWKNELKEQVRFSPLIDTEKNIYVCTNTRLRKFDADGHLLWTWHSRPIHQETSDVPEMFDQYISKAPALYKGTVYVMPAAGPPPSKRPTVVLIDMETGKVKLKHTYDGVRVGADAQATKVHDGVIFFGAVTAIEDGTDTVVAANASDGSLLWKYYAGETMWNFSPSTPGDGTLLFSSTCGVAFRISSEGKLIWKAGLSNPGVQCQPAGGALGPNGIFYVSSNQGGFFNWWEEKANNTLAAYSITDGSLLWKKPLPHRAAQYPAVGKLGSDGPLAVVVPLGDQPMPKYTIQDLPTGTEAAILGVMGGAERNLVIAFDAETGATLWSSEEAPWYQLESAGESDLHNATDGYVCYPDAQGIPLITGDGTVYTSSSHHGDLRAIRDSNKDGVISPSEVSTFKTGKCFLNSPSVAPGMLVAAPCWGPMYVFRN